MTTRIGVAVAALALALASGMAVSAQAGDYGNGSTAAPQGTMQDQSAVGRSVAPSDMDATGTMAPAGSPEAAPAMAVAARTSGLGSWNGIEITPQVIWDAMARQGLKPLNGFLVRHGDYVLADAVHKGNVVRVAFDPKIGMIRSVRLKEPASSTLQ